MGITWLSLDIQWEQVAVSWALGAEVGFSRGQGSAPTCKALRTTLGIAPISQGTRGHPDPLLKRWPFLRISRRGPGPHFFIHSANTCRAPAVCRHLSRRCACRWEPSWAAVERQRGEKAVPSLEYPPRLPAQKCMWSGGQVALEEVRILSHHQLLLIRGPKELGTDRGAGDSEDALGSPGKSGDNPCRASGCPPGGPPSLLHLLWVPDTDLHHLNPCLWLPRGLCQGAPAGA